MFLEYSSRLFPEAVFNVEMTQTFQRFCITSVSANPPHPSKNHVDSIKKSSVVPRCRRANVTVSLAAQRGRLALHHEHQRLGDGGPGHRGGLETSLNDHLHLGLGRALVVASRAHVRATVFRSRRQDLHRETAMARMRKFEQKKKKHTRTQ